MGKLVFLQSNQYQPTAYAKIYKAGRTKLVRRWLWGVLAVLPCVMLLPWTQNIRTKGKVTTMRQEQRPQDLNSIIAGKIVKWYVKEGDFVNKGDTILQLAEVKTDYFDPDLLARTQEQITAKEESAYNYQKKSGASDNQKTALEQEIGFKLQALANKKGQQKLKAASDSMDVLTAVNELAIYERQITAAKIMLDSGAIALTEFEKRKANYQSGLGKKISAENKYNQSKQELVNIQIEQQRAAQEAADKIAKAEGDSYGALSSASATQAEVYKLKSLLASYAVRNQLYYLVAPQSGQVTKAKKEGLGELVKEGETVAEIVPRNVANAVEIFVEPMDLPLFNVGQKLRFVFDGYPAIVFSGWPKNSYGTFGGKVSAIEGTISDNGKYRVLVQADESDKPWPAKLSLGTGASGIALMKDVLIGYELWRNINGFPPDYYTPVSSESTYKKKNK